MQLDLPTYLPKNLTSYVNAPKAFIRDDNFKLTNIIENALMERNLSKPYEIFENIGCLEKC